MAGRIVQKRWPPLAVPDYGSYLAHAQAPSRRVLGFAGSNGFSFLRQLNEFADEGQINVVGGRPRSTNRCCATRATRRSASSPAAGIRRNWTIRNRKFAPAFRPNGIRPGFYAAATYVNARCCSSREAVKGRVEDKAAFMKALRTVKPIPCVAGSPSTDTAT